MRGILKDKIYSKHEDEQQQLRIGGNSWTINLDELPDDAVLIEYITNSSRYVINRDVAFDKGFVRTLGGEKKLVVPIKYWQQGIALSD